MMRFSVHRRSRFPILVENSKIPVWLSKIAPIEIQAISFAGFIFCRDNISKRTWKHEMIHFLQQKELYFIGQWILYYYFIFRGYLKYRDMSKAYARNPFEQEAFANEANPKYLLKRIPFAWKLYKV